MPTPATIIHFPGSADPVLTEAQRPETSSADRWEQPGPTPAPAPVPDVRMGLGDVVVIESLFEVVTIMGLELA